MTEEPAHPVRLSLAQAWLNNERSIETVVRRGTELGVDRFVVFRADHSERAPRGESKWVRWAVESCKQCGRNRLPEFETEADMDGLLERIDEGRLLCATQHAPPIQIEEALGGAESAFLLIGPEGDFTSNEIECVLRAGGQTISLGPYTLRSEVAATVAVTLVQHALGRLPT